MRLELREFMIGSRLCRSYPSLDVNHIGGWGRTHLNIIRLNPDLAQLHILLRIPHHRVQRNIVNGITPEIDLPDAPERRGIEVGVGGGRKVWRVEAGSREEEATDELECSGGTEEVVGDVEAVDTGGDLEEDTMGWVEQGKEVEKGGYGAGRELAP